jgi:hypothetical protein
MQPTYTGKTEALLFELVGHKTNKGGGENQQWRAPINQSINQPTNQPINQSASFAALSLASKVTRPPNGNTIEKTKSELP